MAHQTSLNFLPAEILDHVLGFLPKDSLANLRLASKFFKLRANHYLYHQLTLRNSTGSAARAKRIIKKHPLACMVRDFCFDAGLWRSNTHLHDRVRHVLYDLRKLQYLSSLGIIFDGTNKQPFALPPSNRILYSSDVLATIFLALTISRFHSPRIERLSIKNLQSRNEPYVTTSLGFLQLLRGIHMLELSISTLEHESLFPRTRNMSIETMSFYVQLPLVWLAPASQNLRTLCLSADAPWGWYPKVDLRGIYFPFLKDLTLARFTFSHDWQLQWLSGHAGSLTHLVLTECAILDNATSAKQHFDGEGYPPGLEPDGNDTQVKGFHSHKTRWSDYFRTIEASLPEVRFFSLLSPDHAIKGTHLQAIINEEVAAIRNPYRYLEYFWNHYLPLFGRLDEVQNYLRFEARKSQQDEDEQALRELLASIQRRITART